MLSLLLAIVCVTPRAADAQTASTNTNANTAAASPSPTATPISISSIVSKADETDAQISQIRSFLDSQPDNFRISSGLTGTREQVQQLAAEVESALRGRPSLEELNTIESRLKSLERTLSGWSSTLRAQAAELDARVSQVRELRSLWQRSLESYPGPSATAPAQEEAIPPEARRRANETIFSLGEVLKEVERRRSDIIDLQAKVSDLDSRLNGLLRTIRDRRAAALEGLFVSSDTAIWNADGWGTSFPVSAARIGDSLEAQWIELRSYLAANPLRFVLHGILIILLVFAFSWMGTSFKPMAIEEPKLERASKIFGYPIAAAIMLSIFFAGLLYPAAPPLLTVILGTAVIVPAAILLRLLIDPPLRVILYVLIVFFLLDRVRDLVSVDEFTARLVFLVELLIAAVFCFWFRRSTRVASKVPASDRKLFQRLRGLVMIAGVLFSVAFLANVAGFVPLSQILGGGLLRAAYAALILYALYELIKGIVMFAIRVRPLSSLAMVRSNRTVIRIRMMQAVRLILFLVWLVVVLRAFSISDLVFGWISSFFAASVTLGSLTISAGDILGFVLAVWIAFMVSRFLRFILEEDVFPRVGIVGGVSYAVSTMVHYAVLVVGFLLAIAALGFEFTQFAFIAGAVGIGVGFGLQNIINNFVSGLILLFERPVKVGDTVQIAEHIGSLTHIGLRASVLRKVDGSDVIVPNSQLISEEVVNWTMSDEKRRLDVPVGVAYGTDPKLVIGLLTDVAIQNPGIMDEPKPRALFVGMGESSLDFELRGWTEDEDWVTVKSELVTEVHAALTNAGIEIPFPQRDLNLRGVSELPIKIRSDEA
ncbi:MAG TPA: mechanosensitive ion channel domain-containing protein [Pyrinomonadaceae bacterium]